MRIGELARRTGVSERSLRYYEEQGLLAAERTPGGHRDYPGSSVDRVIRIQELFAAGLHSAKIAQLLPCMRDADGGPSEIATPRLVTELTAERDRVNRMIADVIRSRDVLDEVIEAASRGTAAGEGVAAGHGDDDQGGGDEGEGGPGEGVRAARRPFQDEATGQGPGGDAGVVDGDLRGDGHVRAGGPPRPA
ncbi:hypothetical protein GCM10022252_62890 [Streptosporangium oxazolinicum]|uniref:HTH merR-type domain-containing protein n=1 Tax=Streptosporangium oxazolinicum TaxID=909287 RepID=A0ABP8BDE6_9ACTN